MVTCMGSAKRWARLTFPLYPSCHGRHTLTLMVRVIDHINNNDSKASSHFRHQSVCSPRMVVRRQLPRRTSHRLVTRCPPVWHGLWWHSLGEGCPDLHQSSPLHPQTESSMQRSDHTVPDQKCWGENEHPHDSPTPLDDPRVYDPGLETRNSDSSLYIIKSFSFTPSQIEFLTTSNLSCSLSVFITWFSFQNPAVICFSFRAFTF